MVNSYYRKIVIITFLLIVVLFGFFGYVPIPAWYEEKDSKTPSESSIGRGGGHHKPRNHVYTGSLSNKLPKLPPLPKLIKLFQGGKYPPLKYYNLTDEKVQVVANLFDIRGLDSSVSLQRNFLGCPAKNIVRDASIREFVDGRFVLTKQYQTCKKLSFKKRDGMVGLISYPGSGNSWVRQLLETSTGVFTGSIYCDKSYVKAGMIGEGIRSEFVAAVKCHNCRSKVIKKFSKVIYIVRNPFDTFLAEFTRRSVHRTDAVGPQQFNKHVVELGSGSLGK